MAPRTGEGPPVTPDGRYLVVRGRLWRRSDPRLGDEERAGLTAELMSARRAKGAAMRAGDEAAREAARARVDAAKHALGERGPVWWDDGAPDLTRHLARTGPYAGWWAEVSGEAGSGAQPGT
ncbi:biopolymer transporter Tol [Aquipuribacter hungaricus]|uniref:Biopolymer transporter Tol n=1 Tax=Aquipuribacter hungaricus TaxID=545624 RepID=A0ABV7WK63_9MICO